MQVYEIKGFTGLLSFILAVLALVVLLVIVPAFVMQVFWNAIVFEGLGGPAMSLLQGGLLWAECLILFKLVANPQISFQFKKVNDTPPDADKKNS